MPKTVSFLEGLYLHYAEDCLLCSLLLHNYTVFTWSSMELGSASRHESIWRQKLMSHNGLKRNMVPLIRRSMHIFEEIINREYVLFRVPSPFFVVHTLR